MLRNDIIALYDRQISFIGIARTLDVSVKEVLNVLRAAGRVWERRATGDGDRRRFSAQTFSPYRRTSRGNRRKYRAVA